MAETLQWLFGVIATMPVTLTVGVVVHELAHALVGGALDDLRDAKASFGVW